MRIAVVGTYRSGSSAVAGVLHHLGVELGSPFWGNHFESQELAAMLRRWWSEPLLVAALPMKQRQLQLAQWIQQREATAAIVGAKHPLLSLCLEDLEQSWGAGTRFIWCKRPIEQATSSLERCGWWPDSERIQRTLDAALQQFFESRPYLAIDFADIQHDPRRQIQKIAADLNIQPSPEQLAAAFDWLTNQSGDSPAQPTTGNQQ